MPIWHAAALQEHTQNGKYRFGSGTMGRTAKRWQVTESLVSAEVK
jgi:hypothetical protein